MTKRIQTILIVTSIICGVFLLSCKDDYTICDQNRLATVNGSFFLKGFSGNDISAPPPSLTVTNLNGTAQITNAPAPLFFSLGLNPNADSSKFVISLSQSLPKDTISYYYTTQSILLSPNCGNVYVYTLTSTKYTKNTLDSIAIINPAIETRLLGNVKFYY